MVGKIKHARPRIHQEAVKLKPSSLSRLPDPARPQSPEKTGSPRGRDESDSPRNVEKARDQSCFPTGVFAGTRIPPEALVQRLTFEEPLDAPAPAHKGKEEMKVKSKKEKMKERRERWLSKISSIKQAQEQQAAATRRRATPVVGDLRPLADALPELCQLITPASAPTARRKSRKNKAPVKRPEPTDFSQMKHSQKRKLLETETLRFREAVKTLSAKMNPLVDIGEQLRKRMRQEEEEGPG